MRGPDAAAADRAVPGAGEERPRRLAHLDGLRGVAILLVLADHLLDKAGASNSAMAKLLAPLDNSGLGVELFFALSGYLITTILLRERMTKGTLSLRRFYGRRVLRIWPAFYLMLGAILLVAQFSRTVQISAGQAVSAGLFAWNYSPASGGWWLAHTWSLSIEEQFYLLWPLVLVLCTPRAALRIALVGIAVEPVIRVASYFAGLGPSARIPVYFHTRADSLLFGAAVALLPVVWPQLHLRIVETIARRRLWLVALGILALSSWAAVVGHGGYQLTVGWTIDGLCCATILLATQRAGWLRGALSLRPLVLLGLVSFSLYLWQQLFMGPWGGPILGSVALSPVLSIACAIVSYRYVERPFLRLKRRLEAPSRPSLVGEREANRPTELAEVATAAVR